MKNNFSKRSIIPLISAYAVPILFVTLSAVAVPLSGFSIGYLVQEIIIRMARNSFLVFALIIPILAGMGLNFGMVLGAMAGQIGIILIIDWDIVGINGVFLAMIISIPLSILLGFLCGKVLNMAKGREMITGLFLGFFVDGLYQLFVLYFMGSIIPVNNKSLVLSRGYGIRNAIDLQGIRKSLDNFFVMDIFGLNIPCGAFFMIILLCVFIILFKKTKLGLDMKAVGQDMSVSDSSGISVNRTRIISIIISTVLAGFGQIIFLQNIGTLNTYSSHTQAGQFAAASILIGGATVARANIKNVLAGVLLFHLLFIVSPKAGQNLLGDAMIGEYFRQFISYGIIAVALILHSWKRLQENKRQRRLHMEKNAK